MASLDLAAEPVLLPGYLDEFNSMLAANVDARALRARGFANPLGVVTYRDFSACFPELDFVLVVEDLLGLHGRPEVGDPEFAALGALAAERILELHPSLTQLPSDFALGVRQGEHVYRWQFGQMSRFWLEGSMWAITGPATPESLPSALQDWLLRQERFVVVNGRNLSKHPFRNQILEREIASLLNAGLGVANATFRPPGLSFPADRYLEIPRFTQDYGHIAYVASQAGLLLTVADSGGASTHMCIPTDVLLLGKGGWVDNRRFGWAGQSMVSARRQGWPNVRVSHFRRYRAASFGRRVREEFF